jgi:hypothetical protein
LGLKSMAYVHKPTPVAPSSPLWRQLYLGSEVHGSGTQARSGGNSTLGLKSMAQVLKPAPAAKLFVFSDFSFALAFRKVLFVFLHLKSAPRGILKSTSKSAYQSPLRVATKVDFGFQVASQSPLRAAQS